MTILPRWRRFLLGCGLILGLIMLSLLAPAPARAEAGRLAHLEADWGAVSPQTIAPTQKDLGGLSRPPRSGSQGQELAITLAVGIISLVVVVYLVVRRYRRQDVDEEEVEEEAGEEEGEEEL